MTNHESPTDLQGFRRTEAGYFAAFVPVLAEPLLEAGLKPAFKHGEAWESTTKDGKHPFRDSRGGRSKLSGGRWG